MDGRTECKKERKEEDKQTSVSVYLHGPVCSVVIGGSDVIIRGSEGGVPDLVLALVEQKVGSICLKSRNTDRLIDWSNSGCVYVFCLIHFLPLILKKENVKCSLTGFHAKLIG